MYRIGTNGHRDQNITNLFFVDDLKFYATTMNQMRRLLDQVIQFSRDIGMKFDESKCAYMVIERGEIIEQVEPIVMNDVTINPMKTDECYKYLGQDENISYVGPINKDRVTKEHTKRRKKIWTSELSAYNKHNAFAVPVLIPTFGILDWTIQEIEQIDTQTRKIFCMTGNCHRNSDVDRLYLQRKRGGRGLKSVPIAYESRVISIRQHLRTRTNKNCYLECVVKHEEQKLLRVGNGLLQSVHIVDDPQLTPRGISLIHTPKN